MLNIFISVPPSGITPIGSFLMEHKKKARTAWAPRMQARVPTRGARKSASYGEAKRPSDKFFKFFFQNVESFQNFKNRKILKF